MIPNNEKATYRNCVRYVACPTLVKPEVLPSTTLRSYDAVWAENPVCIALLQCGNSVTQF